MKAAMIFCLFLLAAVALARPDSEYTTRYDDINLKEIVCNPKILQSHFNCLLEKGPCPPDGKELKSVLPDALQTACSKCNDKQKKGSEYIIGYLYHHKPEMWMELVAKYDPENKYSTKYAEQLNKTPSDYSCN